MNLTFKFLVMCVIALFGLTDGWQHSKEHPAPKMRAEAGWRHKIHVKNVGKPIGELQIQVVTYVFELSVGNCHCYMAALSSFIVTCNDR